MKCKICARTRGTGHKMSCDYAKYPSQYPNGSVWVTVEPRHSCGFNPIDAVPNCDWDRTCPEHGEPPWLEHAP